MPSLKDLGPLTIPVKVRGEIFEVHGIAACDVFDLIANHPQLESLMQTKVKDFNPILIVRAMPAIVGVIIAVAIGKKDDKEEVEAANKLGFSDQLKFMSAIFELTFSDGVGPFVDELKALTKMIQMPKNKASDTASPGQLSGQVVTVGVSRKPGRRLHVN